MVGNSVDVVSVLDSVGCSVEVSSMNFVVVSISASVEVGGSVALAVVVSSSSTSVVDDWSVDVSSSSTPTVVESSTCKSAGEGDGGGDGGGGEGAPWNCGYVSASSPSCGGFGLSPFTTSRKESDEGESPSD